MQLLLEMETRSSSLTLIYTTLSSQITEKRGTGIYCTLSSYSFIFVVLEFATTFWQKHKCHLLLATLQLLCYFVLKQKMRRTCKMKATLPFYATNSARTWHANEHIVVSILYPQTQNWGNKHHILCYNSFCSKDSSNHYWQFMKFHNFFLLGNSLPYTNRQYCGARWSLAESFVGKLFSLSAAWQTDKHFPRSWTNSTLHYPQVVNYKGKPIWLLMK